MGKLTSDEAGIINAGAQVLGQGINAMAQGSINKKTRKYNQEMYERQRRDSLADWNMQNEYNSPQAQMARLKQAGLNPHLVYGDGATHTASPIRSAEAQGWNPRPPQFDAAAIAHSGLFTYFDMESKKAQIDNLKAQNTVAMQDALLRAAQTASTIAATTKTGADTKLTEFNLEQAKALQSVTLEQAQANLRQTQQSTEIALNQDERNAAMTQSTLKKAAEEILTMRLQRAKTSEEINLIKQQIQNLSKDENLKTLDIDLKKIGIQPGDNIFFRMLGRILNSFADPNSKRPSFWDKIF